MSARSVPFFNYAEFFEREREITLPVMEAVLSRGAFILQSDLLEFEKQLAAYLNVKHAFGVADGTEAITIALLACGLERGEEVIVASHTMIASVSAIHFAGGTPVLVECGPDHLIDPADVERAITARTRAIMPVQLNGRTADMDAIGRLAEQKGLIIVEDAAQALGSSFNKRCAGTFGSAGTFSFYPAKILGCYGDGGAIVTNDSAVAARISMLRDHGRDPEGVVRMWGMNSRLDNMQAAILNAKLKTVDRDIARRREVANLYHRGLGHIQELSLPPAVDSDPRRFDAFQNYEIEAERRDELKAYLEANHVRTLIQWGGKPVHQFKDLNLNFHLPRTDRLFQRCLLLPMNTCVSNEDVAYVCCVIERFYRG